MKENIRVEAKNKEDALKKGLIKLQEKNIDATREDLIVKLIEENKGFLGFGKKNNLYQIELNKKQEKEQEVSPTEFLDDINIDGEFKIKIADDGVFVKVIPPQGQGEKVQYQLVKKELDKKEIVEIDWRILQEAVNEAEDEWIKIAPRKPELDREAEVNVEISKDRLKAFLDYRPALGGKKLTFSALKKKIKEKGVVYGLKDEKIKLSVDKREPVEKVLIAEGKAPVAGKDAEYIYHFEQKEDSIGTEREDGSIDFFNLGLINNVQPGDALVSIKKPVPGEPGIGVDGKEIPPKKPVDKSLPGGKNVEARDERTLVATISGQVVKSRNKIDVLPVHHVKGNVDLSTGNIDFVGNVQVQGDVLEGFEIKAEGNVEVKGNVNAATVESGGEVVVHKGFIGKKKGKIEAEGDVKIKFVENGNIKTSGDIYVTDAVMHSRLISGNKIDVTKNKGLIVGGKSRAAREIAANIIGSAFATETHIEAGNDPDVKERTKELKEDTKKMNKNLLKTKRAIKLLQKMKKKIGKLPVEKEKMYQKLLETEKRLEKKIEDNELEMEELNDKMRRIDEGRIVINTKIYPGVRLTIGKASYNVQDEITKSIFIEEKGEVRTMSI